MEFAELFRFEVPILETVVRGSFTFLMLFFVMRFVLKRQAGAIGIGDLLVVVLIADASQNAMAGEYTTIADGMVLVGTIVAWNYGLEWAAYRWKFMESLLHPQPLPLIKYGRLVRANMRAEFITKEELMTQLREQGIDDVKLVKTACLEGDGKISVVTYDRKQNGNHRSTNV